MKSFLSLIKFVNNSNSNENIVIGLIIISNGKLFYNISQTKLNFVKRLNSDNWMLFNFALDKFNFYIHGDNELVKDEQLGFLSANINGEFLLRLSKYQNGVFQISEPELILKEFDRKSFNHYFRKLVGEEHEKPHPDISKKVFRAKLEKYYHNSSFNRVDLHYKIQPELIPGLFFPVEVEFIAKNGQLLVGQAIDFNLHTNTIVKNFTEFENLVYNLEKYSQKRDIGKGSYKLIVGKPKAKSEQEKIFNNIYEKRSEAPFQIIEPEELEEVAKVLEEKQFERFSEFIVSGK